jgi:hypothetical protein
MTEFQASLEAMVLEKDAALAAATRTQERGSAPSS